MKLALVGDIGGTNARFALWRDNHLEAVQVLPTADFPGPEQAIVAYLQALGLQPGSIGSVCLACAGPVSGNLFRFTNNHWRIDRTAFCEALQIDRLLMINDFSAMALGMTRIAEHERVQVCPGEPQADPSGVGNRCRHRPGCRYSARASRWPLAGAAGRGRACRPAHRQPARG